MVNGMINCNWNGNVDLYGTLKTCGDCCKFYTGYNCPWCPIKAVDWTYLYGYMYKVQNYQVVYDDKGVVISVNLAGIDPKNIKVSIEGSELALVTGDSTKDFKLTLSDKLDFETATAENKFGLLEVTIKNKQYKQIHVTVK